jgi:putative AlgH/UPF0301 family transcriptional regulator|tara:strand:- start:153 stop:557 length:405 start_codon:yes stop_codon:yes gene_type:complete
MDLEKYLKDQLEHIDLSEVVEGIIRETIGLEVDRAIRKEIKAAVETKISELITAETNRILMGGPVKTDDGWHDKKTYANFDELFKKLFKERLDSSYDMKGTISRITKDKVNALFNKKENEIAEALKQVLLKATK